MVKSHRVILSCFAAVLFTCPAMAAGSEAEANWPQWRGPEGNGISRTANPPLEWSEVSNVRWKVQIPGKGHSSPIVWGNQVLVTTAVPSGIKAAPRKQETPPPSWMQGIEPTDVLDFTVISFDRSNGKIQWRRTPRRRQPHQGTHGDGSWASHTPVTDGELIWAYFGSNGLYCYDMDGALKWEKDLGDMNTKLGFGEGSSPALHGETLVINWDHEGQSFITALNKRTGEQLWKADREEMTTWSTPLIVEHDGRVQVITNGTSRIRSYDLTTGELIWESSGMTQNVIPTPVVADGLVFLTSGFRGNALQAVRLGAARGDVTGTEAIAWTHNRDTPYVPSPLVYGGILYFLKTNTNILSCFDAQSGKAHYSNQRLEGVNGVYSSPTAAQDRIYLVGRQGTTVVLKQGPEFEVQSVNKLNDRFDSSPALAGDEMFLRGHRHLYSVAE